MGQLSGIWGVPEGNEGWPDYAIRVVTIEDQPWFVAADVCRCLELGWDKTNQRYAPSRMVSYLLEDEIRSNLIATEPQGKLRHTLVISESGLYKLIMRSDKPQARAIQDWITREVLPSIRKTGAYVTGQPSIVENPNMDPLSLLMAQAQLLPKMIASSLAIEQMQARQECT